MNRTNRMATLFLGQVGVALLMISILLVPQSRSLAVGAPPEPCESQTCQLEACPNYWILNASCPDKCSDADGTYCNCALDQKNCGGCVFRQNSPYQQCYCNQPAN